MRDIYDIYWETEDKIRNKILEHCTSKEFVEKYPDLFALIDTKRNKLIARTSDINILFLRGEMYDHKSYIMGDWYPIILPGLDDSKTHKMSEEYFGFDDFSYVVDVANAMFKAEYIYREKRKRKGEVYLTWFGNMRKRDTEYKKFLNDLDSDDNYICRCVDEISNSETGDYYSNDLIKCALGKIGKMATLTIGDTVLELPINTDFINRLEPIVRQAILDNDCDFYCGYNIIEAIKRGDIS